MKKETYQGKVERINKANSDGLNDISGNKNKPLKNPKNTEPIKNDEALKRILSFTIGRLVDDANDVIEERKKQKDDFNGAECMTYYKVLESIKDSLEISALDPEEFGLTEEKINQLLQ